MWLYWATYLVGQALRPYWRLATVGDLRAIPREGPLIVASNHASYLDPWLIGFCFPRGVRFLISRDWYFRSKTWNAAFRTNGTIPVAASPSQTIEAVCSALNQGAVVGIFPEGRISPDGRVQPFHAGLARIAAVSGAPVLPLGIRGNHRSLPLHRRWPRPNTIRVHVGSPIVFPGGPIAGPPKREASEAFQLEVLRQVCSLAGQEGRAVELSARTRRRDATHSANRTANKGPSPQRE